MKFASIYTWHLFFFQRANLPFLWKMTDKSYQFFKVFPNGSVFVFNSYLVIDTKNYWQQIQFILTFMVSDCFTCFWLVTCIDLASENVQIILLKLSCTDRDLPPQEIAAFFPLLNFCSLSRTIIQGSSWNEISRLVVKTIWRLHSWSKQSY